MPKVYPSLQAVNLGKKDKTNSLSVNSNNLHFLSL